MLGLALIVGGWLRLSNLGAREMSGDEGASWAAAAAPTAGDVIRLQTRLNPGKLALHELAMHAWMSAFGDGLATMRALPAALGTFAILLVFFVTRELASISERDTDRNAAARIEVAADADRHVLSSDDRTAVAALSALIFAVNLVTIKYSREARMYPMLLAAALAQVAFFLRAARLGGLPNYLGVAVFTALSLAAQFMAALVVATEGLWLLYVVWRERWRLDAPQVQRAWRLVVAFVAAVALLSPFIPAGLSASEKAVNVGTLTWIKTPPSWEPFALFNKASGTFAFPVMGALAAWGAYRQWRRARDAVRFALLWMWAPVVMLMLVSYLMTPVFVERYMLSCFVAFFILIALGIWELPSNAARLSALVLVVALALGHVYAYDRKPHDFQWREAAAVAASRLEAGQSIAVAPPYAFNVVRYYLRAQTAADKIVPALNETGASVLIIGYQGVPPEKAAALSRAYPRLIAHLRGLTVRER